MLVVRPYSLFVDCETVNDVKGGWLLCLDRAAAETKLVVHISELGLWKIAVRLTQLAGDRILIFFRKWLCVAERWMPCLDTI